MGLEKELTLANFLCYLNLSNEMQEPHFWHPAIRNHGVDVRPCD